MKKLKTLYKLCLIKSDLEIEEKRYKVSVELAETIICFLYSRYKRIPNKNKNINFTISSVDEVLKNHYAKITYSVKGKIKTNIVERVSKNIIKLTIKDENIKDTIYKYYLIKKK